MSAASPLGPLRLLVVTSDTYPPQRVDLAVLYGEELSSRGHLIDWIMQSEAECRRAFRARWGGGTVWVSPVDRGASLPRRLRKHFIGICHDVRLFRLLGSGRYDAIEVKDKFISAIFGLLAARMYRKRFIYWLSYLIPEHYLTHARDGTAPYPLLYRIRGEIFRLLLYRVLLPRADHIFVQSERMRLDLAARGVPISRMTPVPMGIKLDPAGCGDTCGKRRVIPEHERCMLYLGSLWRGRRLEFLLEVLVCVRAELPDTKLYFIGGAEDPADEQLLEREAERLGVRSALVFTGLLPRERAHRYVADADVCVSPVYPTPALLAASLTKLIEYMALGKPVVATMHPDQTSLIEESGCGYCVPYDVQAFAEAVVRLMRTPELAREMGLRGRTYALEHRSYERIADLVERQLVRAVAGVEP